MRTILIASSLLVASLAFLPGASATDDLDCRQDTVTICQSISPLGGHSDCVLVAAGNPQTSSFGGCVRNGDQYVCVVVGQLDPCVLTA